MLDPEQELRYRYTFTYAPESGIYEMRERGNNAYLAADEIHSLILFLNVHVQNRQRTG